METCLFCRDEIDLRADPLTIRLQFCCGNFFHNDCLLSCYAHRYKTCPTCSKSQKAFPSHRVEPIAFERLVPKILQWMFPGNDVSFDEVLEWVKTQSPEQLKTLMTSKLNAALMKKHPEAFFRKTGKKATESLKHARKVQQVLLATLLMANASPKPDERITVKAIERDKVMPALVGAVETDLLQLHRALAFSQRSRLEDRVDEIQAQFIRVAQQLARCSSPQDLEQVFKRWLQSQQIIRVPQPAAVAQHPAPHLPDPNGGFREGCNRTFLSIVFLLLLLIIEFVLFIAVKDMREFDPKEIKTHVDRYLFALPRVASLTGGWFPRFMLDMCLSSPGGPLARYADSTYYLFFRVLFYSSIFWVVSFF